LLFFLFTYIYQRLLIIKYYSSFQPFSGLVKGIGYHDHGPTRAYDRLNQEAPMEQMQENRSNQSENNYGPQVLCRCHVVCASAIDIKDKLFVLCDVHIHIWINARAQKLVDSEPKGLLLNIANSACYIETQDPKFKILGVTPCPVSEQLSDYWKMDMYNSTLSPEN
jgi:hypothetical protein